MESFRKSSEEPGTPGRHPAYRQAPRADAMPSRKSTRRRSGFRWFINRLDNGPWLWAGMTLAIAALLIGWRIVSSQGPDGIRLFGEARQAAQQTAAVDQQTIAQLEDRLTGLVDRVARLTDSITYLESKLIRAHVLTDSIITAEQRTSPTSPKQAAPVKTAQVVDELATSAAGQTARQTPADSKAAPRDTTAGSAKTLRATSATAPATEYAAAAAKRQVLFSALEGRSWVVNLTSSPSRADADRFAAKARSKGIETQQQEVTVKGRRYWRVQTTGFATAYEAQSYAGTVRDKLGLQEVWITRR